MWRVRSFRVRVRHPAPGRGKAAQAIRVILLALAAWSAAIQPALAALHPGDILDIVIFDHPELSGPATVSKDGFVSVLLSAGLLPQAQSRTAARPPAASARLHRRLLRGRRVAGLSHHRKSRAYLLRSFISGTAAKLRSTAEVSPAFWMPDLKSGQASRIAVTTSSARTAVRRVEI